MKKIWLFTAWMTLVGCGTDLQGGLSEREANEILLVLMGAGIEGEKNGQGSDWSVRVRDSDLPRAFETLGAAGLPRPRHSGFLGVYRERGLVPGRLEEQALYLSALQEEIAQTLESVEGVVSARVHLTVQPERKLARSEAPPPTASVLIGYRPVPDTAPPLSPDQVSQIVAHAVVGLEPGRVAVVFTPKGRGTAPAREESAAAGGGRAVRVAAASVAAMAFLISVIYFVLRRKKFGSVHPRRAAT